jgi:hypothetical protein
MLILLPIVAFLCVSVTFITLKPMWDWRLSVLRAGVLLSIYMVLINEFLSLFQAITKISLAIIWILPIMGTAIVLRSRFPKLKDEIWSRVKIPRSLPDRTLIVLIILICIITAVIARMAPPNTWDSLNTHLSRVAHWAQENSLQPYATGIEKQIYYPPFPGIAILQSYVLTSGDHWANFAQWTAMLLCMLGVTYLAGQFKARYTTQLFVALFTLTLPMGIAQSTSTMTDYLVALWILMVAIESVHLSQGRSLKECVFFITIAAGLAINTKPTAFAYLLPFGVYVSIHIIKRARFLRFILAGITCVFIMGLINAGYLSRNLSLYQNPLGPRSGISVHTNEFLNWRVLVSNTVRNASLHAWSPFRLIRSATYRAIVELHDLMDIGITDPRTSVHDTFAIRVPSTDEKKAGNFYHSIFILGVAFFLGIRSKKENKQVLIYSLTVLFTFLVLSTAYKFSIFGSRYHLAFFILSAPFVGFGLDKHISKPVLALLGLFLIISSWNWLVGIDQRPVWPKEQNGVSLLSDTREDMYFPQDRSIGERYQEMTTLIQANQCYQIGIMLRGSSAEYPIWVYSGAPSEDLEIEWIVAGTPSESYSDANFQPCAVICDTSCPQEWDEVKALPLYENKGGYRLFMR